MIHMLECIDFPMSQQTADCDCERLRAVYRRGRADAAWLVGKLHGREVLMDNTTEAKAWCDAIASAVIAARDGVA